jgi:ribonuclease HII
MEVEQNRQNFPENLEYETRLIRQGITCIAGVDEVGRGPLAGPVIAAAVCFPSGYYDARVTDSKKLSPRMRETLFGQLTQNARSWAAASASVAEIDRVNIRQATFLAMRRAVAKLEVTPEYLLVDGSDQPVNGIPGMNLVKGDSRSFTIAAASIIAKVIRDRLMVTLHEQHPQYCWKKNKGYGTADHIRALREFGKTVHHRELFIRKILGAE